MTMELPDSLTEFEQDLYNEWTKGGLQQPLEFTTFNNKTTVCLLKLANNFEIVGTSGCEDPNNFNPLIGRTYALKDALRKLGEFAAFHRAQVRMTAAAELKVLKVDTQLSPFEVEELRRLLTIQRSMGTGGIISSGTVTSAVDCMTIDARGVQEARFVKEHPQVPPCNFASLELKE